MPKQSPAKRRRNFEEVALGYSEEQAVAEAERCLQCKNAPCMAGCPVEIDIPAFIQKIKERKFAEAAKILKQKNALPAICGRVCPQEDQCEKVCILEKTGEPVAIGRLERFIADWEAAHPEEAEEMQAEMRKTECEIENRQTGSPGKVAVIGSGPSGLTVAGDLAKLCY